MKSLSLIFKETPSIGPLDQSILEYNSILNLNVIRNTNQPAVALLNLESKNQKELELTEDIKQTIQILMDTSTTTKSQEPTDSDKY